ncbi:hypothetical protein ACHAXA_005151 [Cyclostephanos tholiformis]|uniref:EF-hand domain-containing protein n=1 Tax=Cyclostephanos tholiformis TaxID=382380 RepID=A0ABD3R424_9STRA
MRVVTFVIVIIVKSDVGEATRPIHRRGRAIQVVIARGTGNAYRGKGKEGEDAERPIIGNYAYDYSGGGGGVTTTRHHHHPRWKFLGRWLGGLGEGGGSSHGQGYDGADGTSDDDAITSPDSDPLLSTTKKASNSTNNDGGGGNANNRNFGARFISGLIVALAEEVRDLEVKVDADSSTPMWDKRVDSIRVYFSRLGFRQLRMGGLERPRSSSSGLSGVFGSYLSEGFLGIGKSDTADEAFDKIDVDKSGSLDVWELAQALKMAVSIGGNKFGMRSMETLSELASRLVGLYDINGDGVVDRQEYQAMVQDMAALRFARLREDKMSERSDSEGGMNEIVERRKRRGWCSLFFGGKDDETPSITSMVGTPTGGDAAGVTDTEEIRDSVDQGEGSIVLEGLQVDLRRLVFGAIPGVKRILPGGPLILKPFTATITCSFDKDDIMDSVLLDAGLRRLVARALSRRVRGIRDFLDGAVFYGRTWKLFEKNAPQVEVAKLEDVHFDKRNRLIITGRAKIKEALGYKHDPIEQGFKLRTKIGTRSNGRIIGLLEPEIAIFAECPKELERNVRDKFKAWFDYTIPTFQPLYTYIPLVSPLKKNDNMDGFNLGEDNQIRFIDINNGKLRIEFSAFLRPGRFLGNHYLAFTVPNRTLILTLDRVREGMRNARRNKRLAELAAREVKHLTDAQELKIGGSNDFGGTQSKLNKLSISPEGKARIQRLEKELKATIQEEAILREMKEKTKEGNGKSFISRFAEGYAGAFQEELENARLSDSISEFFGNQDK